MQEQEIRFAVLKLVIEHGSEMDKRNPIPKADELVQWVSVKPKPVRKTTKAG